MIINRPNAKNPAPYQGKYAISDTATEVRRLRSQGVSVLGVFAGEEKDLPAEKKDFWKGFCLYPGYRKFLEDRRAISDKTAGNGQLKKKSIFIFKCIIFNCKE